ncbi:MAG: NAD(P)H-binding protein [Chloroflexi bacterium]|nr:NAD(P)H-binding protein [Chloroflexota bacterium]
MILITGGTGFIGRALVRQLVDAGHVVRTLIRPSPRTPRLPVGVPVEVAVVSLNDTRGLRAAMRGVDVVYHLIGDEGRGRRADLLGVDIQGTKNIAQAAVEAGIQRMFYISHLGADRASAFPVLKAKAIAEDHIRRSGVPYTILRSSIIFGPEDNFTTHLARLIRLAPGIFPIPNGGKVLLQPLWLEDLVTCLLWSLENPDTINQTYEVGGSEYFTLRQVVEIILSVTRRRRLIVPASTPYLRALTVLLEHTLPAFPISGFWLDYLAVDRTCETDTLPRIFGLMPARFTYRLNYLIRKPWYTTLQTSVRQRTAEIFRGRH